MQQIDDFKVFPDRVAAQAWIDAEAAGIDPIVSVVEAQRRVSWPGMKRTDRVDLRMAANRQHALDLKGTGGWGRTEFFGYNEAGNAFAGCVSFRRKPGEAPPQRVPRTEKGRAMMEGVQHLEGEMVTVVAPEKPRPGFETYAMAGPRLILAHGDFPPVLILAQDGKLVLKRL